MVIRMYVVIRFVATNQYLRQNVSHILIITQWIGNQ